VRLLVAPLIVQHEDTSANEAKNFNQKNSKTDTTDLPRWIDHSASEWITVEGGIAGHGESEDAVEFDLRKKNKKRRN